MQKFHSESQGVGPVLLCLHGLGSGAFCFRGLAQRMSKQFRVMAFDYPGTGRNLDASGSPFSLQRSVDAVLSLVADYPDGQVSLLGHSMGTMVALLANAAAPGKFKSLIFADGLPRVTDMIRERLTQRAHRIRKIGMADIGAEAAPGVFSKRAMESNPESVAYFSSLLDAYPGDVYLQCLDALLAADVRDTLPLVKVPWLAITGSNDAYAPPAEVKEFMDALPGPKAYAELPHCGHMPFWEFPELFAETIAHFLSHRSPLSRS